MSIQEDIRQNTYTKHLHKNQIKTDTFNLKEHKAYRKVQYYGTTGAHRDDFYAIK